MRAFLKKTLSAITIYSLAFAPVLAKDNMKVYGNINEDFTLQYQNLPEEISFKLTETKKVNKEVSIPDGATVTLEVINARRELRWHVSGLILCKLKNYIPKDTETPVDLTDKEIYLVVKKYEPIDGKETGILFDTNDIKAIDLHRISDYVISPDGATLLIETERKRIYMDLRRTAAKFCYNVA